MSSFRACRNILNPEGSQLLLLPSPEAIYCNYLYLWYIVPIHGFCIDANLGKWWGGGMLKLFHLEKKFLDLCMCIMVVVSPTSTNLVDCISVCVAWHVEAYSISYKLNQLYTLKRFVHAQWNSFKTPNPKLWCQNKFKSFSLSLNA